MLAALTLSYPIWFVLLCLMGAAGLTGLLYFKNKQLAEMPARTRSFLMALRFLATFILMFLLLKPLLRNTSNEIEKPVLALLIDNSQSMLAGKDSAATREAITNWQATLAKQLDGAYEVIPQTFGADLRNEAPNFLDPATDFSAAFEAITEGFKNSNMAGVVMVTDGIATKGITPETLPAAKRYPFFAWGVGDTTTRKDARIKEVLTNKVAFSGNQFPVEIFAQVDGLKGQTCKITILHQNKTVREELLVVKNQQEAYNQKFLLEAGKPGLQEFEVRITTFPEETNKKNNSKKFFIDVKERRKKIALVTDAPHPDIATIKRSLGTVEEFTLDIFYSNEVPSNLRDYNLLILHQFPGRFTRGIPNAIASFPNSILYIIGNNMDLPALKRNQNQVVMDGGIAIENLLPVYNSGFTLFKLSAENQDFFSDLPPLEGLMTPLKFPGTGENLLTSKIGRVETGRPLVYLGSTVAGKKLGWVNGTGIWRWRMEDYKRNNSFSNFDAFLLQTIQFLTTEELRDRLDIVHEKQFLTNQKINFEGVLLNANSEPENAPELKLDLRDASGKSYQYIFGRIENRYQLSINSLPEGAYTYKASTKLGNENFEKQGAFYVEALELEFNNLQAQHQWMLDLAAETNGKFVSGENASELIDHLKNNQNAPDRIKTKMLTKTLLNEPFLLILVVLLLGTEWFIRKRSGIY